MAEITQHFRVHYTTVSRLMNEDEAIRLGEMATFHFIATSVEELVRVGTYPVGRSRWGCPIESAYTAENPSSSRLAKSSTISSGA